MVAPAAPGAAGSSILPVFHIISFLKWTNRAGGPGRRGGGVHIYSVIFNDENLFNPRSNNPECYVAVF